ncbi:MAG: phosphate acetyltransferase [Chlamydiae bacterium]|nr:phosphate acetyltransferase [Chlamydiota bacterium]
MPTVILIVPTGVGTGFSSVATGLVHAFLSQGIMAKELSLSISDEREDHVIDQFIQAIHKEKEDVLVIPSSSIFNPQIALALDAHVIFVTTPQQKIHAHEYDKHRVLGCIVNKVKQKDQFKFELPILGQIPWKEDLLAFRLKDLLPHTKLDVLNDGDIQTRRVSSILIADKLVGHMLDAIKPGSLIVFSGDRVDILLAICLAELRGIKVAGILLTSGFKIPKEVYGLCEKAFSSGLPALFTDEDSFTTSLKLDKFNRFIIPVDDLERKALSQKHIAEHIHTTWIKDFPNKQIERHLTPAAFRFSLMEKAKKHMRHILLPEGSDVRIIEASIIACMKGIANVSLFGKKEEIHRLSQSMGLDIPKNLTIIDPDKIRDQYIEDLVYIRRHRNITPKMASEFLENNIILAMVLLHKGVVDGVVAGANTPTADVIRPALQIIKTKPDCPLVSSIFFMCLETQVLVYGDCAVNTNPSFDQLGEIAIQSADSAKLFGIEPKVAMISYSTLQSGSGEDVEKVRKAIDYIKQKRPDILVDGPLQYDAAYNESIAVKKAKGSKVAGHATVFIFPDLNTGNTTYKAVQQSAQIYAFGPMLQGLNKPVNDLSRGALVEDIVYTIALTSIQSSKNQ